MAKTPGPLPQGPPPSTKGRVSAEGLASFCRRLHCLVAAGVPILPALSGMVEMESPPLSGIVDQVANRVSSGARLSRALSEHPKVFGPLFVYVVAAGEETGRLPYCLGTLADILERSNRLKRQVTAALVYPALVLLFTFLLLIFIALVIFPREQEMYASMGVELPWITWAMMSSVKWVTSPYVLAVVVAQGVLLALSWSTWGKAWFQESLRPQVDRTILRLPIVGPVLYKVATTRMLIGLSTMLEAGLLLTQTSLVGLLSGNEELNGRYQRFLALVKDGMGLGAALDQSQCFPVMVRHLVRLGEEHGQMAKVLGKTALAFEEEVEVGLSTMASLLEPIAICFMGATVGAVVLASLLPTLNLMSHL